MSIWHVNGGNRLFGTAFVQGSKNAALPIMAASVLCGAKTELMNVPCIADVGNTLRILRNLGCTAEMDGERVYIDSAGLTSCTIPPEMMEGMRSSVIFLGALLARCGEARVSLPGGCNLGARPIDLHLAALRAMGADIEEDGADIVCKCPDGLRGAEIEFPMPSVGATENAMLAACAAKGETVIRGAAREPEIVDLQEFLRCMGAYISGAGSDTITISGFDPEKNAGYRIMPDRIVCATLMCAAASAGGDVELRGVTPAHFSTVTHLLNAGGCDIIIGERSVRLHSDGKLRGVGSVSTGPYPGFPTDAQPLLMAALAKSKGRTEFTENIFENRYRHVPELIRMGADIAVSGKIAAVWGADSLHGAAVSSADLRAGAALIVAGLGAEGETVIADEGHIVRGYDRFEARLRSLGADIWMEQ